MPPALFFFFNDTATTEIYPLSLHDALPISILAAWGYGAWRTRTLPVRELGTVGLIQPNEGFREKWDPRDRKSTRLNSSHGYISHAVFCLKKKRPLRAEEASDAGMRDASAVH